MKEQRELDKYLVESLSPCNGFVAIVLVTFHNFGALPSSSYDNLLA